MIILVCSTALLAGTTATFTSPEPSKAPTRIENRTVNSVFHFVHAHRQGRGATVAWSTPATPATVQSFCVVRTYDDPSDPYAEWFVVNTYNCSSARNYKCTESAVSPGYVNYKVLASMTDGSIVESEVKTVHIVQH
jgi:hypothetical protein